MARERPTRRAGGRGASRTCTASRSRRRATRSRRISTRCAGWASSPTPTTAGWCWCPAPRPTRRPTRCSRSTDCTRGAFVQCHPGSRWLFKCWPAASTAALLDRIAADGHTVVLTGAPDERERALVGEVLAAIAPATRSRVIDLAGALSLSELAALTARARAFIGVDSAPMHIAAAVGTPVVALFGPSGEHEWGPWRVRAEVVVSASHPCRPCGIDGCGGGKVSECLSTLPVERVHAAFARVLGSAET